MQLKILSAGAAQGVINALADSFRAETGCEIAGTFGAVGAMKEKLLSGEPADVIVLTRAQIAELAAAGQVVPGAHADLGTVRTGVAVRSADPAPDIADAQALRDALLGAQAIFFPDPQRATAGIHFAKVLRMLGIAEEVAARLQTYPNGATAMREMAGSVGVRLVGVTQITEINNTAGVKLAGPLPQEFELATIYSAGVCTSAEAPDAARRFVALLCGETSQPLRKNAGFELS
jgi:molybdate transport system substrate-binding protein